MRKLIGIVLVQLAVLLGAIGSAAASGEDNQRFFAAGQIEDPAIMIAGSGVVTGAGSLTAESVDFRPEDSTYRETDLAVIGGGSLTLSINGRFSVWPFTLDPRSCTQRGTLSGVWTIAAAGGDLAGATGGGTLSGRFFTYASHSSAGCDLTTLKGLVAGPMVGHVNR